MLKLALFGVDTLLFFILVALLGATYLSIKGHTPFEFPLPELGTILLSGAALGWFRRGVKEGQRLAIVVCLAVCALSSLNLGAILWEDGSFPHATIWWAAIASWAGTIGLLWCLFSLRQQ